MTGFVRNPPDDMTAQLRAHGRHRAQCNDPMSASYLLWAADEIDRLRAGRPVESSRSTPERAVIDAAEALAVARDALRSYSGPVNGWLRLEAETNLAIKDVESTARALRAVVSPGDGQQ